MAFAQAEGYQPWEDGTRLHPQCSLSDRSYALPEHGGRLTEALRQGQQTQNARRVPSPCVGDISAASRYHYIGRPNGLERRARIYQIQPAGTKPAGEIWHDALPYRPVPLRKKARKGLAGCPTDGFSSRAISGEVRSRVRNDHDLCLWPLLR